MTLSERSRLKHLRKKILHLTQQKCAERYHLLCNTWQRWERGYHRPSGWHAAYIRVIEANPIYIGNLLNTIPGVTPLALAEGKDFSEECAEYGHA